MRLLGVFRYSSKCPIIPLLMLQGNSSPTYFKCQWHTTPFLEQVSSSLTLLIKPETTRNHPHPPETTWNHPNPPRNHLNLIPTLCIPAQKTIRQPKLAQLQKWRRKSQPSLSYGASWFENMCSVRGKIESFSPCAKMEEEGEKTLALSRLYAKQLG